MRGSPDPDPPAERTPTVVVARRPRPGLEAQFEAWLAELSAAAGQAAGHLGSDIQRPDATHPEEWVILYRFATFPDLHRWLESDTRRDLIARGADLVEGPVREQVIAVPRTPEPVTALSSVRVRPGQEAAYREAQQRVFKALAGVEGFQRAELIEAVGGAQEETITCLVFDDRGSLQRWLDSDVRDALLADMAPLVEGERAVNVVGGYAGWFAPEGGLEVRRWKQAVTVLAALFPVSLLITVVRGMVLPDIHVVPAVLLANVIGVAVLSWILMPWLTRLLDPWLRH